MHSITVKHFFFSYSATAPSPCTPRPSGHCSWTKTALQYGSNDGRSFLKFYYCDDSMDTKRSGRYMYGNQGVFILLLKGESISDIAKLVCSEIMFESFLTILNFISYLLDYLFLYLQYNYIPTYNSSITVCIMSKSAYFMSYIIK